MDNSWGLLCDAIIALETKDECVRFLKDLLTPQEMATIANRWMTARLLDEGLTQREVVTRLGVSLATVSRVNRALKFGEGGYQLIMKKLQESKSL